MHFSDEVMRLIVTGALSHSILVALASQTLRRVVAQFGPMQTSWSVLNHPRTLDWARVLDIPGVSWTNPSCSGCSQLARHGLLEAVKWARANGWPWDYETCANAARNGHLATLQWARANGCPWDMMTTASAALNGHLATLQWAQANGCP